MKKFALLPIIGLSLFAAPLTMAKTSATPQTVKDQLGFYALFHPELENLSIKQWKKDFQQDYAGLFKNTKTVNQAQYVAFEQQRLQQVIEKRREGSLKQAHIRFGVINSNKDDKITLNEFQAIGLKTFAGFDKNQDGLINAEDLKLSDQQQGTHDGLRLKTPLAMPMANNIQEFIELYSEGKPYVTLADYLTARDKQFFAIDQNNDLVLSEKEYVDEFMQRYDENLNQAHQSYQTIFSQQFELISQNKTTISLKSIQNYAENVFKSIDLNNNGILDKNEL